MKVTRKERVGWYFYDWANSAFSTTVITVFIGPYLTSITSAAADAQGMVHILGVPVFHGSYFAYIISLSVILQVLVLPYIGALADYSGRKKLLLGIFAYLGAFATMAMYFLHGSNFLFGGFLFLVANLSFGASVVVYNSYLSDIAEPGERDSVSSMGWAIGYIGGGIVLALNLLLFTYAPELKIATEMAVRISLCSAGIWWAIFTLVPLLILRTYRPLRTLPEGEHYMSAGSRQLIKTFRELKNYPQAFLLLVAYLFYNDGVQSVITLSAVFGKQELGLGMTSLTQSILMVQFVAFLGSLLFNYMAKLYTTKRTILFSLVVWTICVVYAYAFLKTEFQFFILAAVIALVLGGSQALSRSIFSQLIPKGKEAEYFSLYEVSEKGTSWMGPLLFGLALQITQSYRTAIFSLIIFFVIGFVLLLKVNIKKGIAEASIEGQ